MYMDRARMDFLLPDLSPDRLHQIEERTNALLAEAHPVSIQFFSRAEAFEIPDLIRTRVNLIPEACWRSASSISRGSISRQTAERTSPIRVRSAGAHHRLGKQGQGQQASRDRAEP